YRRSQAWDYQRDALPHPNLPESVNRQGSAWFCYKIGRYVRAKRAVLECGHVGTDTQRAVLVASESAHVLAAKNATAPTTARSEKSIAAGVRPVPAAAGAASPTPFMPHPQPRDPSLNEPLCVRPREPSLKDPFWTKPRDPSLNALMFEPPPSDPSLIADMLGPPPRDPSLKLVSVLIVMPSKEAPVARNFSYPHTDAKSNYNPRPCRDSRINFVPRKS